MPATLPSKCRVPLCTYCDRKVWHTVTAKLNDPSSGIRAGQVFPMWPAPDSVYAVLETPTGTAPGVAFCTWCAPAVGRPALEGFGPILSYQAAKDRYAAWYDPTRETLLRAWLRDALSYEAPEVDRVIELWKKDCRG